MLTYFQCILVAITISIGSCKKGSETPESADDLRRARIQLDFGRTYQTIDGFGFFGAKDAWWRTDMWDTEWGEKVIADLGITIWRSEIYPPATVSANQDADWTKQRPVVVGLKAKANQHNVNLKFIASVWSPPADMKWAAQFSWAGGENATRWEDSAVTTKNGGTLNPNKYGEFADYLNHHIQLYQELGIDLYALSLQNEPAFSQSFNSCTYTTYWYNDLLVNVVPKIKQVFPGVNIFGAEHMLSMEGMEKNWRWFYHSAIKANAEAAANLDILAVHGYSDGVLPNSGSELVNMWENHVEQFSEPMGKKVWMSETSGYSENWETTGDRTGALGLGLDMMAALVHGNVNAWVWWQGSELDGIDEYNLMNGTLPGSKYFVSKHYYRFIRPGAIRIQATSTDEDIFVTAFKHAENGTVSVVIINAGEPKSISLNGSGLPAAFEMYRTNPTGSENCTLISEVSSGDSNRFLLPGKSIVTLQAGGNPL